MPYPSLTPFPESTSTNPRVKEYNATVQKYNYLRSLYMKTFEPYSRQYMEQKMDAFLRDTIKLKTCF